eukprot:1385131-Rhodomonas_salina.1
MLQFRPLFAWVGMLLGRKRVQKQRKFDIHPHALEFTSRQSLWQCDGCRKSSEKRYRCPKGCDFDLCDSCWETLPNTGND